jgi:hypothetical protein
MCIARPVQGYKGLVDACRQRANELAISRLEIDRLAGLPSGYSAKLLGKDGTPKPKRMLPASLGAIIERSAFRSSSLRTTRQLQKRFRGASLSIIPINASTTNAIRSRCHKSLRLRTSQRQHRAPISELSRANAGAANMRDDLATRKAAPSRSSGVGLISG